MNEIAVVGLACRFPGAKDQFEFWDNLEKGVSSISEIPSDRWDINEFYGDLHQKNKCCNRWGGFISDIDQFDPGFFNISTAEAQSMDPQQRLALQTVWNCIEDSGVNPEEYFGTNTGVFFGVCTSDYHTLAKQYNVPMEAFTVSGLSYAVLANRISYFFNFKGPSLPVDTACSSSLFALHYALESIRSGECENAVVGGVNALLSPYPFVSFCKAGMLSPTGECRSFSNDADGYVRGEGVGVILLKKLEKALADRDRIYGIIPASSVNHGGKGHNLTSPNPYSQAAVISDTYEKADISPDKISYIEAHGTGTIIGDPLEILGLRRAFFRLYKKYGIEPGKESYCGISSVKTNIGHLEGAAGIAGVIKVLLSIKHRMLPALQNFSGVNQKIKLKGGPFYLVEKLTPWEPAENGGHNEFRRIAGVSSFGFGGANAHIAIIEYPLQDASRGHKTPSETVLCYSGSSEDNLIENLKVQLDFLENRLEKKDFHSYAYTCFRARKKLSCHVSLCVKSPEEAAAGIKAFINNEKNICNAVSNIRDYPGKKQSPANPLARMAYDWVFAREHSFGALFSEPECNSISIPGYVFNTRSCWYPKPDKNENLTVISKSSVKKPVKKIDRKYFEELWKKEIGHIEYSDDFPLDELDSLTLINLLGILQKEFRINIDWNDLLINYNTPKTLTDHLIRESRTAAAGQEDVSISDDDPIKRSEYHDPVKNLIEKSDLFEFCRPERWLRRSSKNRLPVIFLVTSMRHGSSLSSFILNANPHLYAPQGLYLLPFANLQEREEVLKKQILYLDEGLLHTIQDLWKISENGARDLVSEWKENKTPVMEIYEKIQEKCHPRILVDRGTMYGLDPHILERALDSFSQVKFIHLLRHPYSVLRSGTLLLKKTALLKGLINSEIYEKEETDKSIHCLIDKMWARTHLNFLDFSEKLTGDHVYRLKFENLLMNPRKELRELCGFLDIPFSSGMLNPYNVEENVALHNKKGKSGFSSIDPNVMKKTQIDNSNVNNWAKYPPKWEVSEGTRILMKKLSYIIPERNGNSDNELFISLNKKSSQTPPSTLLVPGFGGNLQSLKNLFKNDSDQVVALKIRDYVPYNSINNFSAFYYQNLENKKDIKNIFGYSFGALAAWELAALFQKDGYSINRLIIVDRNPYYPDEKLYIRKFHEIEKEADGEIQPDIQGFMLFASQHMNLPDSGLRTLYQELSRTETGKRQSVFTDLFPEYRNQSDKILKFVGQFRITRKMIGSYKAGKIDTRKTRVVYYKPEETATPESMPGISTVTIPDCDHFSILDKQDFLESVRNIYNN